MCPLKLGRNNYIMYKMYSSALLKLLKNDFVINVIIYVKFSVVKFWNVIIYIKFDKSFVNFSFRGRNCQKVKVLGVVY